jgi:biopolymer transport protein TolR
LALSANDPFATGGRRGRRRRGRRGALSEINVTPLVDVMLVLLIIFMVSAPLLTPAGVPLELPKTEAAALSEPVEPVTVSIRADGKIFTGDDEVPFETLAGKVDALAAGKHDRQIYVRADGKAPYEVVARVMASLSTGGYTSIGLLTDTGGPSSGAHAPDEGAR